MARSALRYSVAQKASHAKASRARSASRARVARAASQARAMKKAWRYKGVRGRLVRQRPAPRAAPQGGGDMSDSEDSRILEPVEGDSDGDLEPGAGQDYDAQLPDDVDLGAVGGDAPDGQPDEAQDDQPVGAALPPLLATLGGRTIRVRLLLDGAPVLAPPGLVPLRVNPACPHCHTIPMVSGRCCSNVGERKPCPKCQSLLWPGEKGKCCRDGKEVLGPDLNPPIDAPYLALLKELHFSHNSRLINSQLAMGSQGTFPSRDVGGLGFHDQPAAFLHLFGKSYLVMRNPRHNNSNMDNFLLPQQLLYDGAVKDLGEHYAGQLCRVRSYLQEHHPFARRLRVVDDMDGERIDLSGCIRIEAHSEKSGAMELAFLDSGVRPPGTESNKVLYFDLGREEQNLSPNVTVSRHSAMFELLQFLLLY